MDGGGELGDLVLAVEGNFGKAQTRLPPATSSSAAAVNGDNGLFTPVFRELHPSGSRARRAAAAGSSSRQHEPFVSNAVTVRGDSYDADSDDERFVDGVNSGAVRTPQAALQFLSAPGASRHHNVSSQSTASAGSASLDDEEETSSAAADPPKKKSKFYISAFELRELGLTAPADLPVRSGNKPRVDTKPSGASSIAAAGSKRSSSGGQRGAASPAFRAVSHKESSSTSKSVAGAAKGTSASFSSSSFASAPASPSIAAGSGRKASSSSFSASSSAAALLDVAGFEAAVQALEIEAYVRGIRQRTAAAATAVTSDLANVRSTVADILQAYHAMTSVSDGASAGKKKASSSSAAASSSSSAASTPSVRHRPPITAARSGDSSSSSSNSAHSSSLIAKPATTPVGKAGAVRAADKTPHNKQAGSAPSSAKGSGSSVKNSSAGSAKLMQLQDEEEGDDVSDTGGMHSCSARRLSSGGAAGSAASSSPSSSPSSAAAGQAVDVRGAQPLPTSQALSLLPVTSAANGGGRESAAELLSIFPLPAALPLLCDVSARLETAKAAASSSSSSASAAAEGNGRVEFTSSSTFGSSSSAASSPTSARQSTSAAASAKKGAQPLAISVSLKPASTGGLVSSSSAATGQSGKKRPRVEVDVTDNTGLSSSPAPPSRKAGAGPPILSAGTLSPSAAPLVYYYWIAKRAVEGPGPLLRSFQTLGPADFPVDVSLDTLVQLVGEDQLQITQASRNEKLVQRLRYRLKQAKANSSNREVIARYTSLIAALGQGGGAAASAAAAAAASAGGGDDDDDADSVSGGAGGSSAFGSEPIGTPTAASSSSFMAAAAASMPSSAVPSSFSSSAAASAAAGGGKGANRQHKPLSGRGIVREIQSNVRALLRMRRLRMQLEHVRIVVDLAKRREMLKRERVRALLEATEALLGQAPAPAPAATAASVAAVSGAPSRERRSTRTAALNASAAISSALTFSTGSHNGSGGGFMDSSDVSDHPLPTFPSLADWGVTAAASLGPVLGSAAAGSSSSSSSSSAALSSSSSSKKVRPRAAGGGGGDPLQGRRPALYLQLLAQVKAQQQQGRAGGGHGGGSALSRSPGAASAPSAVDNGARSGSASSSSSAAARPMKSAPASASSSAPAAATARHGNGSSSSRPREKLASASRSSSSATDGDEAPTGEGSQAAPSQQGCILQ